MKPWNKEALLKDLRKLHAELPSIIVGVEAETPKVVEDAKALIRGSASARIDVAMGRLVDYVLDEANKGNKGPLIAVASGRAFEDAPTP
jgi:hypothetical protein